MNDLFDDNNTNNYEDKGFDKDVAIGERLFPWRDYTPFVFFILLMFVNKPNVLTAVLGTLLMLLGLGIRVYSVSFINEAEDQSLVTEGPFSFIRNPLDLGTMIIIMGTAIFSASIWFILLTAISFSLQYYFISKYEEYILTNKLGDVYKEYMANVPAWIPRKKITLSEIVPPKDLSDALHKEKKVFGIVAICLVVLVAIGMS